MTEYTLYLSGQSTWWRSSLAVGVGPDAFPAFLGEMLESSQVPSAGSTRPDAPSGASIPKKGEPNGLDVQFASVPQLRTLLASKGWEPKGALLLGEHAATLLEACVSTARWLVVRATPDQVAAMQSAKLPVTGASDAGSQMEEPAVRAALASLRKRIPADFDKPGALALGLQHGERNTMRVPTVSQAKATVPPVPPASTALSGWLRSWADAKDGTSLQAGSAVQQELNAAYRVLSTQAGSTLRVSDAKSMTTVLALAAWSLEQALLNLGQTVPWMTLGAMGARAEVTAIAFPLDAGMRLAPARIAPYDVVELGPNPKAPVRRDRFTSFRLNKSLRDKRMEAIPTRLTDVEREAWMRQQLIPEVRVATNPRSLFEPFPEPGVVAFTPFGELWVITTAAAWKAFGEATTRRAKKLAGADLGWETLANTSQGSMWVPLLSSAQLAPRRVRSGPQGVRKKWTATATGTWRGQGRVAGTGQGTTVYTGHDRDQVSRYEEDIRAPNSDAERLEGLFGTAVVPRAARPYLTDSKVRAQAFAAAFAGEPLDWITSHSIIRWAFKGEPDKVLLPVGTVVYKFNDFTSLFMPKSGGLNTEAVARYLAAQSRISPWWSPWDGLEYGGGWGERIALSKFMGAVTQAGARGAALSALGNSTVSAPASDKAIRDLGEFGPLLEMARETSVVKENWNSLRYIVAIKLVKPAYAFFGGFGSLNRIDLNPQSETGWAPEPIQRRRGEKAQVAWSKGTATETGRAHRDMSCGQRRTALRGLELPGGSTQLYITGLRWYHKDFGREGNFVFHSIDDPAFASLAIRSVPHATTDSNALGSFNLLDLTKASVT